MKNTIQINGKEYDARTGELLRQLKTRSSHVATQHTTKPAAKIIVKTEDQTSAATPAKISKSAPATHHIAPRTSANSVHRSVKRSTTLHRRSVQLPDLTVARPARSAPTVVPKGDPRRLERAKTIQRSSEIQRFNRHTHNEMANISSEQDSEPEELPIRDPDPEPDTADTKKSAAHIFASHESLQSAANRRKQPTRKPLSHHIKTQNKGTTRRRARFLSLAAASLAILLLGGYVAYLNMPGLSMRVAAHESGFAATMPSQIPGGYSLTGPIAHTPGQVVINFAANTDPNRRFTLKQLPSAWDSQALGENFVALQDKNYTKSEENGLTIYTYNSKNAAWVNNGRFFVLESSDAELSPSQIATLATSM